MPILRWQGVSDIEDAAQTLGPRLRAIREGMGLTLRQLADRIGASKNTVLRIEQGFPISESIVNAICAELKTSVPALLGHGAIGVVPIRVVRAGEAKRLQFAKGRVGVLSLELREPRAFPEKLRGMDCLVACLSGELMLEIGQELHCLAAGDCAVINCAMLIAIRPVHGNARALLVYEELAQPRGHPHKAQMGRSGGQVTSSRSRV